MACAALNGQNIQVTWKPPPSDKVHGVVQGYKLVYEATNGATEAELQGSPETRITHALSAVLHGLNPYTNYTVQVLAYTRAGDGVSSTPVSCTTEETGELQIRYLCVQVCVCVFSKGTWQICINIILEASAPIDPCSCMQEGNISLKNLNLRETQNMQKISSSFRKSFHTSFFYWFWWEGGIWVLAWGAWTSHRPGHSTSTAQLLCCSLLYYRV